MGQGIINQNDLLPQVLQEYINLVEDVDTKLNLATKFKCHDVVIDVSPCEKPELYAQRGVSVHSILWPRSWGIAVSWMDEIVC